MWSQIDYFIHLTNTIKKENIIHWSWIEWKKVTNTVFAAEIYRIAHGFDIIAVIKKTPRKILKSAILSISCSYSKSLYNCLVKCDTTQEKPMIADVIHIRPLYNQLKSTEVKYFVDIIIWRISNKNKPLICLDNACWHKFYWHQFDGMGRISKHQTNEY